MNLYWMRYVKQDQTGDGTVAGSAGAAAGANGAGSSAANNTAGSNAGQNNGQQNGQANGQQGNQVQAKWPDNWRQEMTGGDEKELKQAERYLTPADVWKKTRSLEQKLSSGEYKAVVPF